MMCAWGGGVKEYVTGGKGREKYLNIVDGCDNIDQKYKKWF